jgi:hypothetical protein
MMLTLEALPNLKLRTRGKNRIGDVQPRGLGDGEQDDGALAVRPV